jgi:two-component system sensor histidine kinase MtrB
MVAVSVGFSLVAVILIGWLLSFTIEQNLFETRRLEVVSETQAVSGTVQAQLDDAIDAQGSIDVESANGAVQATIRATTNSPGLVGFAILRAPGQTTDQLMTSTSSVGFPIAVVSDGLRDAVHADRGNVHYQSVELPAGTPGIVTGANIDVPTAGRYDLVLGCRVGETRAVVQPHGRVDFSTDQPPRHAVNVAATIRVRCVARIADPTHDHQDGGEHAVCSTRNLR